MSNGISQKEELIMNDHGNKAIYLFCFTRSVPLPAIEGTGVDGKSPLFLHRVLDIVAILSEVPIEEFSGPSAESRMQDLSWVGPRACRHEEVLEQAMHYSPVLPARFGTLFSSVERLEDLVKEHHDTISDFLDEVVDKEEWAVKGMLDRDNAKKELLSTILNEQAAHLSSLSPGKRYFQEQRIMASVEKELNAWLQVILKATAQDLSCLALEACERRVLSRGATGCDMDMVLNWAFLMQKSAVEDFRARIDRANAEYEQRGLVFELSGPWPPYSFSPSLEIAQGE